MLSQLYLGAIVSFREIFAKVLRRCNRVTHFNVDVRVECFAQVRIVWDDKSVVRLAAESCSVIVILIVPSAVFRITIASDVCHIL